MSDVRTVPLDETEPARERVEPGVGTVIDKYVIRERIGAGGCGTVYAAFDSVLERDVALKLLGSSAPEAETTRDPGWPRLVREARMLAKLSEPQVVTVFEVGAAQGRAYLAMELVRGGDLKSWIEQHRAPEAAAPVSLDAALDLLEQAGSGLAVAHEAGVVHGDFKPANVLIDARGRAKVSDFGIARLARAASKEAPRRRGEAAASLDPGAGHDSGRTVSSTGISGTPAYMAPEQFERRPPTERCDVYAYCTTVYEAVYGKLPFEGHTVAELAARKIASRPDFEGRRDVPRWLIRLLERGLQAEPEDRPQSMGEVLDELARARARPRRRWFLAGGAVVGAGAVAALLLMGGEEPCPIEKASLSWDATAAWQVQQRFGEVGGDAGAKVADRVGERLGVLAEQWQDAHRQACRTAWTDPRLGAQAFACLRRRRSGIEALIGSWQEASARTIDSAVSALEAMPSAQDCLDAEALANAPDLPADPELREKVIQIDEDLDAAITMARTGDLDRAMELARSAHEAATQLGHEPVLGRATLALGQAHELDGELEAARDELQHAFFTAQRWDDPRTAAAAAERLAYLVGTRLEEHEQGLLWTDHAKVALAKAGGSSAVVLSNEGSILERLGRYDEALQRYEAALQHHDPEDAYGLGVTHLRMGDALRGQGRADDALAHYEAASKAWARALGDGHPRLSVPTLSRATALAKLGRLEQAVASFEQAIAGLIEAFGPEHPNVAAAHMNLGVTLKNAGRYDDAEASLREAVRINVAIYGDDHLKVAQTREALGRLLTLAGRPDDAVREHELARTRFDAELDPGHPDRVLVQLNLGDAHRAADRHDEAIAAYRTGVTEASSLPEDHVLRGDALAYLGRGLATAGRHEQARPILEEAIERLEGVEGYEDVLALAQAWLARGLWNTLGERDRAKRLRARATPYLSPAAIAELEPWAPD